MNVQQTPDEMMCEKIIINAENQDLELNDIIKNYEKANSSFEKLQVPPEKIELIHNNFRIQSRGYNFPEKYKTRGDKEICRLLEEGIIAKGKTQYASPEFFIEKKNLDLRLVVDYSQLNKYLIDETISIPKIHDLLIKMSGCRIFSQIDLSNGFNQVPLDREARKYTGFVLKGQTYYYKRVSFGLKSRPKLFQRVISEILSGIQNVFVYIDDIVIYAKTQEEHDLTLKRVLKRLIEHKARINFEKSAFGCSEIKILGFKVNQEGYIADQKHLNSKIFSKNIKTKKERAKSLRSFKLVPAVYQEL